MQPTKAGLILAVATSVGLVSCSFPEHSYGKETPLASLLSTYEAASVSDSAPLFLLRKGEFQLAWVVKCQLCLTRIKPVFTEDEEYSIAVKSCCPNQFYS